MEVFHGVPFDLRRERNRHPREKNKKLVLCFQEQEPAPAGDLRGVGGPCARIGGWSRLLQGTIFAAWAAPAVGSAAGAASYKGRSSREAPEGGMK